MVVLRFSRTVVWWQILIVLGLSLGRSGVYALVDLMEKLTQAPLDEQTTALNPSLAPDPVFDLIRQLLSIGFGLVPVVLVLHLVWIYGRNPLRSFGLDFRRPVSDLGLGLILFVTMGAGTLLVYAVGRSLGLTTAIIGSSMNDHWWTPIVLTLAAVRHSLVEEVIILAWLVDRVSLLRRTPFPPADLGTNTTWLPTTTTDVVAVLLVSSLIRASYHLYQGIGPGIGNAIMGVVFVLVYLKYRRVMPMVWAHLFLDVAGFVGFPVLESLGWFGH